MPVRTRLDLDDVGYWDEWLADDGVQDVPEDGEDEVLEVMVHEISAGFEMHKIPLCSSGLYFVEGGYPPLGECHEQMALR
jgi:hypothetical protein